MKAASVIIIAAALASATAAQARNRNTGDGGGVPPLDVKQSCSDAQKFSTGDDKNMAYKGCMQDEMSAKDQLAKRWSSFKAKDRQNCVEQSRAPSPSYVEVLTCLEMNTEALNNAPKGGGKPVPQIGGPVAPGLSASPVPAR